MIKVSIYKTSHFLSVALFLIITLRNFTQLIKRGRNTYNGLKNLK